MQKSTENEAKKLENQAQGVGFQLRLRTIKSAKNSFARLIREFAAGHVDDKVFRSLVYGLSGFINMLKLQLETNLEEKLKAIEKKLEDL